MFDAREPGVVGEADPARVFFVADSFRGVELIHGSSAGLIRQHSASLTMLLRTLDALLIGFGMIFSVWLYDIALNADYLLLIMLAILIFLFVAETRGLYQSWRVKSVREECSYLGAVWLVVVACLLALGFMAKVSTGFSRMVIVLWLPSTYGAMCLMRYVLRKALRYARSQGGNTRTVAFAGVAGATKKIAAHIAQMPWLGLKVIGGFDDRMPNRLDLDGLSLEGDMDKLLDRARDGQIDIVYVTLPMHAEQRIIDVIESLADTTASVYLVPDPFVFSLYKARWATLGGMPVISTFESPFYGTESWVKRIEDVLLGGLILLSISPLLLLVAAGVKLSSPGPAIFKQRRYGLKGEVVEVWKFRSMTVCDDGVQVVQAKKNDARVTPFGAFLRRTSLDELPQFINVLQGTMSIVGPRPHAVAHNEEYRKQIHGYMLRHKVKPGITGLAQVNGWRGETDTLNKMEKRVEHDLEYIQNWSLWLDIRIILKTILVGFKSKNAY